MAVLLLWAAVALAGDYYVYACSYYGNTAPAFTPYTNADHLTPANGCMQPAPGGGYRSLEINNPGPSAPVLHGYGANWTANTPSPAIQIVGAYTPPNTVLVDCNLHSDGFTAEYFWAGGTQSIDYINDCNGYGYGYGDGIDASFGPSTYFGWGAGCWLSSSCATSSSVNAVVGVLGVRLTAQENSGPSIVADGSDNLWYQGSHWVRSGGWPVAFTSQDASGVCGTDLLVNGQFTGVDKTSDSSPDTASFTQCWPTDDATGTLDTDNYSNGPLTIMYAANNAAGVVSAPSETLQVDNTPVTLSLATPNDSDPNVWVDHSVQVIASASAGPSGIAGTSCSTNSGSSYAYPSGGITLNGTGVWTASCSSQNNALDVNGQPARSPAESVTVHIDETPPTVAFEPVNPNDPTAVVVDTSDAQSGVAGGQVQIRPASGGSWQSLPTQFDGSHLLARFDDATLAPGQWVIQATSCDNAGNCATTSETLNLPVRMASVSSASFQKVDDPLKARVVKERVRVDWHWATVKRHGKRERVKRGRRFETVMVVKYREDCVRQRAKVARHRWREHTICHRPRLVLKTRESVRFGRPVTVHGLLSSVQGVPIPGAPVSILTAPNNGLDQYTQAATTTTAADGSWTVQLPAGPSRIIAAVYNGSPTIQPSVGSASITVPAKIRILGVRPKHVPWGGTVTIDAYLAGGYLPPPPAGELVRLRLGSGSRYTTYGVKIDVTGNGRFTTTYTFGYGPAWLRRQMWFQLQALPQDDYAYAQSDSNRATVLVGGHPANSSRTRRHRRHTRPTHKHKRRTRR